MKASEQRRITLSHVKVNNAFSRETTCFTAMVLFDGLPVCLVRNAGNGGCDHHEPLMNETHRAMDARLTPVRAFIATLEPWAFDDGATHAHDLDTVVGEALTRHLIERDFDRRVKGGYLMWVNPDDPKGTIHLLKKGTATDPRAITYVRNKQPNATILNTLPRAEALERYITGAYAP